MKLNSIVSGEVGRAELEQIKPNNLPAIVNFIGGLSLPDFWSSFDDKSVY